MTESEELSIDERLARLEAYDAELVTVIERVDEKLRAIAAQNEVTAEMVQILGGFVNEGISQLQTHTQNPHAHGNG